MKSFFLLTCCFMVLGSRVAFADIFKIETNDWQFPVDLTWTGKLIQMDPETQVLRFRYFNRGEPVYLNVHVSRIYSIEFDAQDTVNRPFPPTRQDLSTPLPTRITEKDQLIELRNDGFLEDDIPMEVKVRPDRSAKTYTLRGLLLRHDGTTTQISAWTTDSKFQDFMLSALTLGKWIRGR